MKTDLHTWFSRLLIVASGVACFWLAAGCTIIRYVDPDAGDTDGPPPKVVDLLVMMDMSRTTANLAPDYAEIVGLTIAALGEQNVTVRKAALAPLYSRSEGAVPLLFGQGDEDGEFLSFEEAIAFYTYDDGANYLQDGVESDSENLAVLGAQLDTRPVYHPTTADAQASAYFVAPADGFVVLYLSASPRRCAADDAACAVDGQDAANYFTAADADGVTWLELGGGSLPVDKVFHGAIATAEGVDYATFYETCSGYPNFPAAKLDVMQPSEEHAYFGPFVDSVKEAGGKGAFVDLCQAMSGSGKGAIVALAVNIRSML